ncbi:putative zinc-type alcohol dehydrogenase-like protein [Hymenobacter luteus]|uniref:Zinc-type alcohol dehydrogenase-like protein n=2 Tax=Hymenobacter TaxID=89966 RepID=A0ABR6K0R6_9BACT|nr:MULTISPECIES: NAD(P)-dependent alcohol dehydrogenase [Hymenobacter]MBB4602664.1 putative zinc-type alcohol dehydrogenase-like protein [Hymenobacter latericoloratus]MBB6060555.1 putative zinc-type alcohol dehydrogenase-like protein [Hymenobacter luteus]
MSEAKGYAAPAVNAPLVPFDFQRREVGAHDVRIEILFCGVCHSDLHQVRDEWGGSVFPMVPGHEIVGRVTEVGAHVKGFKVGDLAGVGCMVNSCQHCPECNEGLEQYCDEGFVGTYGATDRDGTVTYGGYSNHIVVTEKFVLHVSEKLDLARVAPLLCAGITTWSPLRQWNAKAGDRVAVMGLGGLGHMAVKFAAALGCEVTVFSTSPSKEADAKALGAHKFVVSKDREAMKSVSNYFDLIINTVSATMDLTPYIGTLRLDGTMVLLGVPPEAPQLHAFNLIAKRRRIAGSLIGGIQETQEMLDFCAEHNVMSDVEIIRMDYINEAYERMLKSDVKYRFVLDLATI